MKAIITIIIIVVVVIVGGYFLVNRDQEPQTSEPIKIGALLILSGDAAAWGENSKMGIDMALDDFQIKYPNKNIEILYEDTKGDTKQAVSAFRRFVDVEKVDAIIGPSFQSEVAAIASIASEKKIPVITPSYAPIQNRPDPRNPLMIWMDPSTEASRMAKYIFDSGIKDVAIIGTLDSWENEISEAFASEFTNLGGNIVSKQIVQPEVSDVRLEITKIISSKPEAVFVGTYYQFINTLNSLVNLRYEGKLYSIEVDSYLAEETKNLSDGMQFISPDFYSEDFSEKFNQIYGQNPGIPAGQAYDATSLLLSFITDYSDKEGVLQAMRDMREFSGVSGKIEINDENKTFLPTAIFELNDGKIVKLKNN